MIADAWGVSLDGPKKKTPEQQAVHVLAKNLVMVAAVYLAVWGATCMTLATAALPSDNAGALTTLRRRVGQKTLAQGSYGLDAPDVYYPDFFEGTWRVTSKAVEVSAPCGAPLFGGNASLAAARGSSTARPAATGRGGGW